MAEVTTGAAMAKNIKQVLGAGRAGVPRDLDGIGLKITSKLRTRLSIPGKGNVYDTLFFTDRQGRVIPFGSRPVHVASAPGQPPAVDTGTLRASYGHYARRSAEGGLLIVGTGVEYAKFLEFGTSKIAPRPHLRPVIKDSYRLIRRDLKEGFEGRERAMARRLGGRG